MENQEKIKVLIIDDEEAICKELSESLQLDGSQVEYVLRGQAGLQKIKTSFEESSPYNAVICDWKMPDIMGDEVLVKALEIDPNLCVIMLTAFSEVDRAVLAMKNGAYYYFGKPLGDYERLSQTIRKGVIERETRKIRDKILTSLNLDDILNSIIKAIDIIFHPREYCLAILEYNMVVRRQKGLDDIHTVEKDCGFVKRLIDNRNPLLINNIEDPGKINPLRNDTKSLMAVSLYVGNNFLGILVLESPAENCFSRYDLYVLADFGYAASLALYNERIQHDFDVRSLKSIAHQIKQPLSTIELAVEALLINLDSKLTEGIKEKLDTIKDNTELAENIVKRILLNYKDEKQAIKLSDIFNRIKLFYKSYRCITWPSENSLDIEIDCKPNQMEFVLKNLISNALEAVKQKEKGELTISVEKNEQLILSFMDNGTGIKEKYQQKIFNQIFTTRKENFGTGLGLFLSKSFIEGHNGSINFISQENVETTFTVTIPYKSLSN